MQNQSRQSTNSSNKIFNAIRIDYPNSIYIGETNFDKSKQGVGVLYTDDNYFILSNWNQNNLNDKTLIFTPVGSLIYCQMKQGQFNGIFILIQPFQNILIGNMINNCLEGIGYVYQNQSWNKVEYSQNHAHKIIKRDLDHIRFASNIDLKDFLWFQHVKLPQEMDYFQTMKTMAQEIILFKIKFKTVQPDVTPGKKISFTFKSTKNQKDCLGIQIQSHQIIKGEMTGEQLTRIGNQLLNTGVSSDGIFGQKQQLEQFSIQDYEQFNQCKLKYHQNSIDYINQNSGFDILKPIFHLFLQESLKQYQIQPQNNNNIEIQIPKNQNLRHENIKSQNSIRDKPDAQVNVIPINKSITPQKIQVNKVIQNRSKSPNINKKKESKPNQKTKLITENNDKTVYHQILNEKYKAPIIISQNQKKDKDKEPKIQMTEADTQFQPIIISNINLPAYFASSDNQIRRKRIFS